MSYCNVSGSMEVGWWVISPQKEKYACAGLKWPFDSLVGSHQQPFKGSPTIIPKRTERIARCFSPYTPSKINMSPDFWDHFFSEISSNPTIDFKGYVSFQCGIFILLSLEVQPPFFIGWFPNHHYFSRGLSSSKRNHHFLNGGWLPGYSNMIWYPLVQGAWDITYITQPTPQKNNVAGELSPRGDFHAKKHGIKTMHKPIKCEQFQRVPHPTYESSCIQRFTHFC